MQISKNYSSFSPLLQMTTARRVKDGAPDTDDAWTNYDDTNNQLFQNLLKNKDVQDLVTENDDGTYSSDLRVASSSPQVTLARLLIREQHGLDADPGSPRSVTKFSPSDLAKFKQLTGYNMVQAGGGYAIADDQGNWPSEADWPRVTAAWNVFDLAKAAQDIVGSAGADLTIQNLVDAAVGQRSFPGADHKMWDALIEDLNAL